MTRRAPALAGTFALAAMTRERGSGEACAVCLWRRGEHHDEARIRCGLIEQSGQRDLLSGAANSWRDARDWCKDFEWYAPRG